MIGCLLWMLEHVPLILGSQKLLGFTSSLPTSLLRAFSHAAITIFECSCQSVVCYREDVRDKLHPKHLS